MIFKRILIVGGGAIGSCYGAYLSRGNDLTLICRAAHAEAINSHGLVVSGALEGTFRLKASTQVTEVPPQTLILLTTKAQDVAEAARALEPSLRADTVILALSNGIRIKETIQEMTESRFEVVRGLAFMAAELFERGRVTCWAGTTLIERTKTGEEIRALFARSGLRAELTEEIKKEEWKKLIINCIINPLTAALRARDNEIAAPALRDVRRSIFEECASVAEAEGVRLDRNFETEVERKITGYTNYSSMYQDLAKGKRTEIAFLNGTVVELGRKHGIRTPVNEAMVGLIRFLEGKR
ncbi:MAG: 2-dehydropantoate 2-reductase [Candidatus Methanomethylicia archaeon]|nr:2-dehydropantoate 2-reductase [Candidatus Methanomethylicia archaeon]